LQAAKEVFKPSTDLASFLVEIGKKTFFAFGLAFSGENVTSGGVFAFFGHIYVALDPNPLRHYFGSSCFWKLGPNPRL